MTFTIMLLTNCRSATLAAAAALLLGSIGAQVAQADVTLVQDGEARAALVLPEKPSMEEARTAREIQFYVERISGATLEVVTHSSDLQGRAAVLIGRAAPETLAAAIRPTSQDPSAFALFVDARQVALRGLISQPEPSLTTDLTTYFEQLNKAYYSNKRYERRGTFPQGTRVAAYELLEQLGVRWFFPVNWGLSYRIRKRWS